MLLLILLLCPPARAAVPPTEYVAGEEDLQALKDGIDLAMDLQDLLYPRGIEAPEVVLYDSESIYVFSKNEGYDFPRRASWKDFQIYHMSHDLKLTERDMAICGGTPQPIKAVLWKKKVSRAYFTCAPMTSFVKVQKKRKSVYDTRESYLATIIHEFGHVYMEQELWQIPVVAEMAPRVKALETGLTRPSILREAYAIWCELTASKRVFPGHFRRLKTEFHDPKAKDKHRLGMSIALEVLELRDSR